MQSEAKNKLRESLIAFGLLVVFAAVVYVIFHNDRPYNKNSNACVNQTFALDSSGQCIKDAQNLINWYLYGSNQSHYLAVNGTFNGTTQAAVRKAQSGASLNVNGKLDFETWKLLCSSSATPNWWVTAAKNAGCP